MEMEKLFLEIDGNARKREKTLHRVCEFLNRLNDTLYEKRIGRRVEIPIEGIRTTQLIVTHFGWGVVRSNWGLFVGLEKDGEVIEKLLQETQMRIRLDMLDKIPTLLNEISRLLKEDTEQIGQKLDALESLIEKL